MSRSVPTLQNPAHRFFEYKPGAGILQYYDKEQAKNFEVKMPFEFLVLAQTAKIGGFSKPDNAGYYSNEVLNSRKEPFTVKMKGHVVYQGLYKTEQGIVQVPKAAKYIKSIYIAFKQDGEWVIGNLSLAVGSPLSAWIEFTKKHKNIEDTGKVIMTKGKEEEAPTGKYFPPVFEYKESTKDEEDAAMLLDKVIQTHLTRYFAASRSGDDMDDGEEVDHSAIDPDFGKATPEQLQDFEGRKQKAGMKQEDTAVDDYQRVAAVFDEEPPYSDDDVPPEFR